MRVYSILVLVFIWFSTVGFAQEKIEIPEGMAAYYMVLLKTGPNRGQPAEEAEKIQAAHLENFRNQIIAGKLVCVGPITDGGEIHGVSIYQTANLEEAKLLAETDPAVKAGRLIVEIHPWLGPAGIGKDYGMRAREKPVDQMQFENFQLGFLWRGDKWTPERTPATQKIQEAHLANITRIADEGKMIAAGPFTDNTNLRGVFIFTTKTIDEARALADTDPAVQAGRLKIELHPWVVTKGVIPVYKSNSGS